MRNLKNLLFKNVVSFFNPEQFQGWGKKRSYFEGWYFKVIDATENYAYAIIPGVAMDESGKRQSFIQVLDGKKQTSQYHKFDFESFIPKSGKFEVAVGNNHFSSGSISLNLPDVTGILKFTGRVPWPKPIYSPGIMGPYSFVPFMECYHGIVSMDHSINGLLQINGELIDFNHGRGYIEKDWGRSFPSAYIWMQSNHFSQPGISVKASVAKIPWMKGSFVGFIAGVWIQDHLLRFTTYNKTVLRKLDISSGKVVLVMENKRYWLKILITSNSSTTLASPIRGAMEGRIEESMLSTIEVNLADVKTQKTVFHDTGRNTALEIAGNTDEIIIK